MSNPTDLPPQNPDDRPEGANSADDQPTEAYPPANDQPTEAYPPADDQPTEAYPPADEPAPRSGEPAAPAYDSGLPLAPPTGPAYAAPAAPPAPGATDTRPKRLGWVSLGLAVAGLVLVLIAFVPLLWVSFAFAVVGGILLLAGLVVGIMVLVKKNQGGKGLGIGAIVVSVLGGVAWFGAIVLSLVLIGLASSDSTAGMNDPSPAPSATVEESAAPAPSSEASGEATEAPGETATGVYDEAAYLAEVRPTVNGIFQEIDPTLTDEVAAQVFPDDALIQIGQAVIRGELDREGLVSLLVSEDAIFTQEQAERFYDTIDAAAQKHLVQ